MKNNNSEINILDNNLLIVLDSNAWLDLYKLPPSAIKSIIESFSQYQSRFWLPYQVYIEFNRNVKRNRDDAVKRYKKIKDISCNLITQVTNKINQEFENLKRNNIFDAVSLQDDFIAKIKELQTEIKEEIIILDNIYQEEIDFISEKKDIIWELIESLHEISNTNGFTINELIKIYEEGEIRYKYKIAPGYTDISKKNYENDDDYLLRKYGDLIIWKEILQHVENTNTNLLFIQNEKKSDWWESHSNKKIAKISIEEYQCATQTKSKFNMLNFEQFISAYGASFNLPATTIKDIVSKLKLEETVCQYLFNNRNDIIEKYIEEVYLDNDKGYSLLQDVSLFGGTVESVEINELDNINIIESMLIQDKGAEIININAGIEVNCDAYITEYVNQYVYHGGNAMLKIGFTIDLFFSINFSNLDINPKAAFEITDCDISDEEILQLVHNEFDIDFIMNEDMYRNR